MDEGYIKLFRSMTNWEWYQDTNTKAVFLHLLLNANLEETRFMNHVIPKGGLVIGRKRLATDLGISERSVRTALKHLKMTNEVTIETTNRFSIVTIVNWEKYQANPKRVTSKTASQVTNNRPTSDQQVTTEKEYKNKELKNIKEEIHKEENSISISDYEKVQEIFNKTCIFFKPCSVITKTRSDKIKKLLNQFSFEEIKEVFEKANSSGFLQGKNEQGWVATFDWLIEIDNFVKVKEENYSNREEKKSSTDMYRSYKHSNYDFDALEREVRSPQRQFYDFEAIDKEIRAK